MDRITEEKVLEVIDKQNPRRCCFAEHQRCYFAEHQQCYFEEHLGISPNKRNFTAPFSKSIAPIFEDETGLKLFYHWDTRFDRRYLDINSYSDLTIVENWIEKRKKLIFLRDLLDMSVALSFNIDYDLLEKTKLGELEYKAKHQHDTQAINTIVNIVTDEINNLPFYQDADYICAVPAHPNKSFDLPATIVATVSKHLNKADITKGFIFDGNKESIKDAELEKKWSTLEQAKIRYEYNITDKTVILFDDKYQSGTTMQYIAMKLYQAGAKKVYGLCFVKTMSNKDNRKNYD